jgi:hypothetical protein
MKVITEINCEDERELLLHLAVIRQNIKREIKRQGGELARKAILLDSNCYGDHKVTIEPEDGQPVLSITEIRTPVTCETHKPRLGICIRCGYNSREDGLDKIYPAER